MAVAPFIMSNGFAPAKIYRVVENLKLYFGSAKAALKAAGKAFKTGNWRPFVTAAGDDDAEIIQAFFSSGDLMDKCF